MKKIIFGISIIFTSIFANSHHTNSHAMVIKGPNATEIKPNSEVTRVQGSNLVVVQEGVSGKHDHKYTVDMSDLKTNQGNTNAKNIQKNKKKIKKNKRNIKKNTKRINQNTSNIKKNTKRIKRVNKRVTRNKNRIERVNQRLKKTNKQVRQNTRTLKKHSKALDVLNDRTRKNTKNIRKVHQKVSKNTRNIRKTNKKVSKNTRNIRKNREYSSENRRMIRRNSSALDALRTRTDFLERQIGATTDFALASSAGNSAMAAVDFGNVKKGETQIGAGAGFAHGRFANGSKDSYAGAIGIKHGLTDDTAVILKAWAGEHSSYGGGIGFVTTIH